MATRQAILSATCAQQVNGKMTGAADGTAAQKQAPTRQGKAQWKRGEEPLLNEAAEATAKTRKRTGTWMLSKQHAANHRATHRRQGSGADNHSAADLRRATDRQFSPSEDEMPQDQHRKKRPRSSDRSPRQPGQEKHQRRDTSQARGLESSGDEYSDVAAGVK
ncbi:hypothetical protein ACOMHN_056238 [Nucella lapillus]